MVVKAIFLLAILLPALSYSSASEPPRGASMEVVPWPSPIRCTACVPVQFGELSMQVPLVRLGRIFIHEGEMSGVHFFGPDKEFRFSGMLSSVPRERHLGSYEAAGLLRQNEFTNAEAYFDRLGAPTAAAGPIATLRRIERLDRAKRYTKASRGLLRAYAIQSEPPNAEQVYIVIDGQPTVYKLLGNITPELYEALLSNMQVAPVP